MSAKEAIARALADPFDVAARLELGGVRAGGGVAKCMCPAHGSRKLSLTRGADSTLRVKCWSCDLKGDVFTLIAAVNGLDSARDFREVLRIAGELANVDPRDFRDAPPLPPPEPPRPPPPIAEVRAFWKACGPVSRDAEVSAWLRSRGLDPATIDRLGLARALPENADGPVWATYRGEGPRSVSWARLGYRCVLPILSAAGVLTSVRARNVAVAPPAADCNWCGGEVSPVGPCACNVGTVRSGGPKALPPSGYGVKGLVMLSPAAGRLLRGGPGPLVILEGEPDYLTWAARGVAALGIPGSGTWCDDLARAVPDGTTVFLRTDEDDAGDRYAAEIARSLGARCDVRESGHAGRIERRATYEARRAEKLRRYREHEPALADPARLDQNDLARARQLPADPAEGCE